MQFLRAARNPKKMPQSLVGAFNGQKLDLFRLWLERGQGFAAVEVEVNRRNVQASIASSTDKYMSRTEMINDGRYSKEDIDKLVQARTASGDWIKDGNFPTGKICASIGWETLRWPRRSRTAGKTASS